MYKETHLSMVAADVKHSQMAQVSRLEAELEGLAAVEVRVEFSLGINCNNEHGDGRVRQTGTRDVAWNCQQSHGLSESIGL